MVAAFLFTIYLIAGSFFITRIKFVRDSGLGGRMVIGLFLIKVSAGVVLGLVNTYISRNSTDYDLYNNLGLVEYHNLVHNPRLFFTDIFHSNYPAFGDWFGSDHSYWNDLRTNIILKALGFMNIFSHGNYYINSLFFNFLFFFGHIAFYRIFIHIFPKSTWPVIIGCFLIPSMLYFSSGIHKDGIVFTSLGIFCYSLYVALDCGFSRKNLFFIFLSLIGILLIRNFVAVILFPCALTWLISRRFHLNPYRAFAALVLLLSLTIVALHFMGTRHDPLQIIVAKQQSFLALPVASSEYQNDTLSPSLKSFVQRAPKAMAHAFATPYPGEFHNITAGLLSGEVIACWLLFILLFIFPLKNNTGRNEFLVFAFVFTALIFLFNGYITPSAGALVRYRSIYLPLLITPLLAKINWQARKKI